MVAVFNERSTNVSQAEAFERLGLTVIQFNYREFAKKEGNWKRDRKIVDICRREKPNFTFFSKCNEVKGNVVRKCNRICPTVLWYMDPLNNNFNRSLIKKIRHCSLTFCALQVPFLEAKNYSPSGNIYFLHEGFDPKVNISIDIPKKYDVSFIGTLRGERIKYYEQIKFHSFNNAYGIRHSYIVSQTKINLNFTYKNHGTSDRTYKVLASKGFLLTTPWINMENDFVIGRDLDIFEDPEELKEKIVYYLKRDDIRNEIAENGFKAVQKFSLDNWAKEIVNKVIAFKSNFRPSSLTL
ncbi:MAG: glycosyltransferase family protein [Candidatus Jordarchaeum sp.]